MKSQNIYNMHMHGKENVLTGARLSLFSLQAG